MRAWPNCNLVWMLRVIVVLAICLLDSTGWAADKRDQTPHAWQVDRTGHVMEGGAVYRLSCVHIPDLELVKSDVQAMMQHRLGQGTTEVLVTRSIPDRWGVREIVIKTEDGDFAERLIAEGLAVAASPCSARKRFERLMAAEDEAREAHRGVWGDRGHGAVWLHLPEDAALVDETLSGTYKIIEGTVWQDKTSWEGDLVLMFDGPSSHGTVVLSKRVVAALFEERRFMSTVVGKTIRARGMVDARDGYPTLRITERQAIAF